MPTAAWLLPFPQTATPSVSQCNACHQANTRSQRIFHDNFNNFWGGSGDHSKGIFFWALLKAEIKIWQWQKENHTGLSDLLTQKNIPSLILPYSLSKYLYEPKTKRIFQLLWLLFEGCTNRARPIQPIGRFLKNSQNGTF